MFTLMVRIICEVCIEVLSAHVFTMAGGWSTYSSSLCFLKKKQTKKSVAVVQFLMCIGLELMILSLQFSKNRSEYQFERFCIFVGYVNSFMRSYIILLLLSLKGSWNLAYQYIKTVQQILYHRINWKVQFNYLKKKKKERYFKTDFAITEIRH